MTDADILVHSGDLSLGGTPEECIAAVGWLNAQKHKHVILIAGNHDFAFERKYPIDLGRIHYLENTGIELDGIVFYGSPVQPWFCDWAFNVHRGAAIKQYWDKIPLDTDILVTHGPPWGKLDQSMPDRSDHLGCEELEKRVREVNPSIHVFGHIHGSYGVNDTKHTKFINASVVNEAYQLVNQPIVIDYDDKT